MHNIKSPQSTKTRLNDDDVPSAMSCIGRFLLATLGLVDVGSSTSAEVRSRVQTMLYTHPNGLDEHNERPLTMRAKDSPQTPKRIGSMPLHLAPTLTTRMLRMLNSLLHLESGRAWGALAVANMFLPAAALIPLVHVALEIDADPRHASNSWILISGSGRMSNGQATYVPTEVPSVAGGILEGD